MLLIALTLYVLLMFQFMLIAISMVFQSIFLIKTFILVFTISADCLMRSGNIKKITCWHTKVVEILVFNKNKQYEYLVLFLIFLLPFNFLRNKDDPSLKVILNSTLLVYILYRFSNPHYRLKSCFTCQFFTHDTIEITNEVHTSHS